MEIDGLVEEYRAKTDDELLRLSLESDQLTPDAQIQLRTELASRGIDSPTQLGEFRAEEKWRNAEHKPNPRRQSGFLAKIRDWKRYRQLTGDWPLFSIIASAVHTAVWLVCALAFFVFAVEHGWSKTKFLLLFAIFALLEVLVWDRIQKRIRLKEILKSRSKRKLYAAGSR